MPDITAVRNIPLYLPAHAERVFIVIGGLESGGLTTPIVGTERFCPAQKPTIT
jgi:hypothetical protein